MNRKRHGFPVACASLQIRAGHRKAVRSVLLNYVVGLVLDIFVHTIWNAQRYSKCCGIKSDAGLRLAHDLLLLTLLRFPTVGQKAFHRKFVKSPASRPAARIGSCAINGPRALLSKLNVGTDTT